MSNSKLIPAVPSNEVIFLNEAMVNEEFRNALADKNRKKISDELDRLNIYFGSDKEKQAALDEIVNIDWGQLHSLENLLGRGGLTPELG